MFLITHDPLYSRLLENMFQDRETNLGKHVSATLFIMFPMMNFMFMSKCLYKMYACFRGSWIECLFGMFT